MATQREVEFQSLQKCRWLALDAKQQMHENARACFYKGLCHSDAAGSHPTEKETIQSRQITKYLLNSRPNSPNNTNKRRACSAYTSFVHSLHLFQSEQRTLDRILSDRYQRSSLSRGDRQTSGRSLRRRLIDATDKNWDSLLTIHFNSRSKKPFSKTYRFFATRTEFQNASWTQNRPRK